MPDRYGIRQHRELTKHIHQVFADREQLAQSAATRKLLAACKELMYVFGGCRVGSAVGRHVGLLLVDRLQLLQASLPSLQLLLDLEGRRGMHGACQDGAWATPVGAGKPETPRTRLQHLLVRGAVALANAPCQRPRPPPLSEMRRCEACGAWLTRSDGVSR